MARQAGLNGKKVTQSVCIDPVTLARVAALKNQTTPMSVILLGLIMDGLKLREQQKIRGIALYLSPDLYQRLKSLCGDYSEIDFLETCITNIEIRQEEVKSRSGGE